jgi:cytochrome c oxidase subunit 2
MIQLLIEPASTYASEIDNLFTLIFVVVGFWFVVTAGMFFWLIWRFRARDGVPAQYVTGDEKDLHRWVSIPHALILVCDVVIVAGAIKVWYDVKLDLPEAEEKIRVIGQQWAWTFVHPGADGELDTADDVTAIDELHVKADTLYHFELQSTDVLHSFSVPVFRLKQDAIPGRTITGWFEATRTGQFDIQCAEMCGIGHGIMGAKLYIESDDEHAAWIAQQSSI